MPNTNEYMKEYLKQYRANHPEFRANELKKNNERNKAKYHSDPEFRNKMLEYKKKYNQEKKLESVNISENVKNLTNLLAKATSQVNSLEKDLYKINNTLTQP